MSLTESFIKSIALEWFGEPGCACLAPERKAIQRLTRPFPKQRGQLLSK